MEDGKVYYAEIEELGELPDLEIGEIALFDCMLESENLTYPQIQPFLVDRALKENFYAQQVIY